MPRLKRGKPKSQRSRPLGVCHDCHDFCSFSFFFSPKRKSICLRPHGTPPIVAIVATPETKVVNTNNERQGSSDEGSGSEQRKARESWQSWQTFAFRSIERHRQTKYPEERWSSAEEKGVVFVFGIYVPPKRAPHFRKRWDPES